MTESNEFNNARLAFIQIGPDMTVTVCRSRHRPERETTIVVSDTTANPGLGAADASITRFYLSQDFSLGLE